MTTESRLQQRIVKKLSAVGWLVRKVSYEGRRGCPDLICMRGGEVVFIEVKHPGGTGRLSRYQELEIERIRGAGVEVLVADSLSDIEWMCD
jgi:Holliday junction resolvase